MTTPLQDFYTDSPKWHEKIGGIHALLERVKISEEQSGDGVVLHRGSVPEEVPALVERLLKWGESSEAHPLIKSSAVHYMLEHIHPFRDGNGRMGRLWQTLILSNWNPLFAWMPIETIVHHNQARYYKALQDSHVDGVDCRPFIDFMLEAIENSLYKYVDIASTTRFETGDKPDVPVNVPVNDALPSTRQKVFILLRANPNVTSQKMAQMLGVTDKTIKRALKSLREANIIRRIGSDKTGHWEVVASQNKP